MIGGIAGIALALHLLGLSRTPPFTRETARAAWVRHRPDDTVLDPQLTHNGQAARVRSDQGRGVVWHIMGADTCARLFDGSETLHAKGSATVLHLNDYSAPRVRLPLTPEERDDWANWITPR